MKRVIEDVKIKADKVQLKQDYIKTLKDETVIKLVNSLDAPEEILMRHSSKLEDAAKEMDNCLNCPGLNACKNEVTGYLLKPNYNGRNIIFSYEACRYELTNVYKENVSLFDLPKNLKDADMKDVYTNDKNRVPALKALKYYLTMVKNLLKVFT